MFCLFNNFLLMLIINFLTIMMRKLFKAFSAHK